MVMNSTSTLMIDLVPAQGSSVTACVSFSINLFLHAEQNWDHCRVTSFDAHSLPYLYPSFNLSLTKLVLVGPTSFLRGSRYSGFQ